MSDGNEATFSNLVDGINVLASAVQALNDTLASGNTPLAPTNLPDATSTEGDGFDTSPDSTEDDGFSDLLGDDLNLEDSSENQPPDPAEGDLTPQQRGAITRRKNKDAAAAKQADQPDRTVVQKALKALAAEYEPDDTPEGKQTGRGVAVDLLSRYGVDSVNKLLLEHYQPLIDQAAELIKDNKITKAGDPLDLDDDNF